MMGFQVICVLFLICGALVDNFAAQTLLNRYTRATCDVKYSSIDEKHSMCLTDIGTGVGLVDAEKQAIVDQHNQLRAVKGQPQATNMQKIVWDEEVAKIASKWVRQCGSDYTAHEANSSRRLVPSLSGVSVGQNAANGFQTFKEAIQAWYDEVDIENYQYGTGSANGGVIGHYTQVVNANVARIGCGKAMCKGKPYYVCDYVRAQLSTEMQQPYETGNGDQCPNQRDATRTLCDCQGLVCLNGGTIDLNTCSCSCTVLYEGIDCGAIKCPPSDGQFCRTQWPVEYCDKFTNVPEDCPYMCGKCKADRCMLGQIPFCTYVQVLPSQCGTAMKSLCPKKCGLCSGPPCGGKVCADGLYLNRESCECIALNVICGKTDEVVCTLLFSSGYPTGTCFSDVGATLCPNGCGHCAAPPCTKLCQNGAVLDMTDCSCNCPLPFYGLECEFDRCVDGDDVFCPNLPVTPDPCTDLITPYCPHRCNVCPLPCPNTLCNGGEALIESDCSCRNMGDCNVSDNVLCSLFVTDPNIQQQCFDLPTGVDCPRRCGYCP